MVNQRDVAFVATIAAGFLILAKLKSGELKLPSIDEAGAKLNELIAGLGLR